MEQLDEGVGGGVEVAVGEDVAGEAVECAVGLLAGRLHGDGRGGGLPRVLVEEINIKHFLRILNSHTPELLVKPGLLTAEIGDAE